jgi:hypothetical protein
MDVLAKFIAAALLVWLGLIALLVTVRMLRGDIRTAGLLKNDLRGLSGSSVAPERIVAMVVFPFVLVVYTLNALHSDVSGASGIPSLPDVPSDLLSLLTGGNGLYLAGKIARNSGEGSP